ncbi:MAG: hypothetical protein IJR09_03200 [Paludibacteraceae bacterium]|nr:hypothetical protein [Paludibacteraceae bacterium]
MKRFRIQLILAFIVLICGVSLMGLVYIVFNKPEVYINPGIVVSHPSPVSEPVLPIASHVTTTSQSLFHHTPYSYTYHTKENTSAVHAVKGLYLHSSAKVRSVGGGGIGTPGVANSSGSGSQRGIIYTQTSVATMPMTSFVAVASTRQIAQPEAQEAPQMASMAAPRRAPGPPDPSGPLPEDHQLVEHPIGDAIIPLLFLSIGYIVYRRKRLAHTASLFLRSVMFRSGRLPR